MDCWSFDQLTQSAGVKKTTSEGMILCRRGLCLITCSYLKEVEMPGLMRGMARTAAVVGTATAT